MIVLASRSASRAAMLAAAGVAFEARPAPIDERALEAGEAQEGEAHHRRREERGERGARERRDGPRERDVQLVRGGRAVRGFGHPEEPIAANVDEGGVREE